MHRSDSSIANRLGLAAVLLAATLAGGCGGGLERPPIPPRQEILTGPESATYLRCSDPPCTRVDASLPELIANPLAFDGRTVTTFGYFRLELEDVGLYAYAEDLKVRSLNRVWIDVPPTQLDGLRALSGKHVQVTGKYVAGAAGHFGLYAGRLTDVTIALSRPEWDVR